MNVEIGIEAEQFPENGIFLSVIKGNGAKEKAKGITLSHFTVYLW
jgi:hypothetical protein